MAEKLKAVADDYRGAAPDSTEGKLVRQMDEMYAELQKLFAEGLVEASKNYAAAEGPKNTTREGGVKHSVRTTEDGTKYVVLDGNIFVDSNGKQLSPKQAYNALVGQEITLEDGDTITFVKKLPGRDMYNELFRKYPGYTDDFDIIAVNWNVNRNIIDVFTGSSIQERNQKPKHYHYNVQDFDQRQVFITDGNEVYRLELNIANLTDGKKVAYVKRFIERASAEISEKIKKAETARKHRLNQPSGTSIRNDKPIVNPESVEAMDLEVDEKTESVAPTVMMSERTWTQSEYVQEGDMAALAISKASGVSIQKAKDYIDSVNSIAKMIADDRTRLDYFSSPGRSSFIGNVKYGGCFDFSTLCKKRRLLTGTFTAIQKALPNTALTANEILEIRKRMQDAGLEKQTLHCGGGI